jgi:hypothetical protein
MPTERLTLELEDLTLSGVEVPRSAECLLDEKKRKFGTITHLLDIIRLRVTRGVSSDTPNI